MFCFVMKRRPPRSTLTYTLFPYTTRFRSAGLVWLTKLTTPLFEIFDLEVSWRDIILMGGGLFLLVKATSEIHGTVEGGHGSGHGGGKTTSFAAAIAQILAIDIVFSLDSVITAVGMTDNLPIMVTAVCIAIAVMLFAATPISNFIRRHPTTKKLAPASLLMIGDRKDAV